MWRRSRSWWPLALAVVLAGVYVAFAPHTADLAAQTARTQLFRRSGFVPYWTRWYAGIPTADYSLLAPPLLGVLGPVWLGAVCVVATAPVATALLRAARRPLAGALLVVVGAELDVISGRTTFALGAVLALGALLAVERRRVAVGAALVVLATAASPVAGFLLAVVAVGLALAEPHRRRAWGAVIVAVLVVLVAMAVLSRGQPSGFQPFSLSSLLMATGTAAVAVLAPVGRRVRGCALVTIAMLVVVYLVHSPVGANATRLAVLVTAPAVVATARLPRVPLIGAAVLACLLPAAQLHNDLVPATSASAGRSFVAPLLGRLHADPIGFAHRLELVDAAGHWPSTYLSAVVPLARGWERQVDESRNPMFYGRGALTAATYRAFLDRNAVGAVAVPQGVALDYGSTAEASLVAAGLPYLHQVWSDAHWRLYDVIHPTAIASPPAVVVSATDTGLALRVPAPGRYALRLRWSPCLVVDGGTVSRDADGDASVDLTGAGVHVVQAVWRWP